MKGLSQRLDKLEQLPGNGPFDHLSDEELREQGLSIFEEMEAIGMNLPDDWREQFDSDPYVLAVKIGKELGDA